MKMHLAINQHPEIESMSTHSIESVKAAYEHDLDYVFGHILRHLQNLINFDQKQRFNVLRDSYSNLWRYH